jgi:hypothetical protein
MTLIGIFRFTFVTAAAALPALEAIAFGSVVYALFKAAYNGDGAQNTAGR